MIMPELSDHAMARIGERAVDSLPTPLHALYELPLLKHRPFLHWDLLGFRPYSCAEADRHPFPSRLVVQLHFGFHPRRYPHTPLMQLNYRLFVLRPFSLSALQFLLFATVSS
jgi:hypothetical protein